MTKVLAMLLAVALRADVVIAQSDCLPINTDKGMVELRGRVSMSQLAKDEVFSRALVWGITKTVGDKEIIKDRESGVLKLPMRMNYKYKDTFKVVGYSITILADNGYFEYTVNGFTMNEKPMELYMSTKAGDPVYREAFEDVCSKLSVVLYEMKHLAPKE